MTEATKHSHKHNIQMNSGGQGNEWKRDIQRVNNKTFEDTHNSGKNLTKIVNERVLPYFTDEKVEAMEVKSLM